MDNYFYINKPIQCNQPHTKKDLIQISAEYCLTGNGKYLCKKCKQIFIIPHQWPNNLPKPYP